MNRHLLIVVIVFLFIGMVFQPAFAIIMENHPPYVPSNPIPEDGAGGVPNNNVNLSWTGGDPDGDFVVYDVYFDDVNPPVNMISSKIPYEYRVIPYLSMCKTYYWRIDAYDSEFVTEGPVWRFTTNCFPPSDPIIDGPHHGVKDQEYTFIFMSTNPENYSVQYHVKWGDGTKNITEFYPSGEPVTLNHSWNSNGKKLIQARVRAIDEYGPVSGWSIFEFTVPRNKVFNLNLFELLFTRFPLLQRLLDVWRWNIE